MKVFSKWTVTKLIAEQMAEQKEIEADLLQISGVVNDILTILKGNRVISIQNEGRSTRWRCGACGVEREVEFISCDGILAEPVSHHGEELSDSKS